MLPSPGAADTIALVTVTTALQKSLRVMGNFNKKENYWIERFPFKKTFDGKL